MTAFIVSRVLTKPGRSLDEYRRLAAESIERHGGRYLVRGGEQQILEGEWAPATIIVELPTSEAARAWYASPDYVRALRYREEALDRDLVLVDGVET